MHSDDEGFTTGSEDDHACTVPDLVKDVEEWGDYWSEELVTLYHGVTDQARGMGAYVLDACRFHDFVEFCFRHSSGRKPPC